MRYTRVTVRHAGIPVMDEPCQKPRGKASSHTLLVEVGERHFPVEGVINGIDWMYLPRKALVEQWYRNFAAH